jgi:hypothetical protein
MNIPVIIRRKYRKRIIVPNIKRFRLPGTEHMDKEYHQKWFHVKVCIPMIPVFVVMGLVSAGLMI